MGKRESIRERKTKKMRRGENESKEREQKNGSERITIKKKGNESKMIKG